MIPPVEVTLRHIDGGFLQHFLNLGYQNKFIDGHKQYEGFLEVNFSISTELSQQEILQAKCGRAKILNLFNYLQIKAFKLNHVKEKSNYFNRK